MQYCKQPMLCARKLKPTKLKPIKRPPPTLVHCQYVRKWKNRLPGHGSPDSDEGLAIFCDSLIRMVWPRVELRSGTCYRIFLNLVPVPTLPAGHRIDWLGTGTVELNFSTLAIPTLLGPRGIINYFLEQGTGTVTIREISAMQYEGNMKTTKSKYEGNIKEIQKENKWNWKATLRKYKGNTTPT